VTTVASSSIYLFLQHFSVRVRADGFGHFPVALVAERGVSFDVEAASYTKKT
jgi:hypothetical protein